jgi:hypothetical protein
MKYNEQLCKVIAETSRQWAYITYVTEQN